MMQVSSSKRRRPHASTRYNGAGDAIDLHGTVFFLFRGQSPRSSERSPLMTLEPDQCSRSTISPRYTRYVRDGRNHHKVSVVAILATCLSLLHASTGWTEQLEPRVAHAVLRAPTASAAPALRSKESDRDAGTWTLVSRGDVPHPLVVVRSGPVRSLGRRLPVSFDHSPLAPRAPPTHS